jgi:DNA-binding transcriptional MerR regulator
MNNPTSNLKLPEIDSALQTESAKGYKTLMLLLEKKQFSVRDLGITDQTLIQWKNLDLLPAVRTENKKPPEGNSSFNVLEYFWVQIIKDLHHVGMSLKSIKEVQSQLFTLSDAMPIPLDNRGNLTSSMEDFLQSYGHKNKEHLFRIFGHLKKHHQNLYDQLFGLQKTVLFTLVSQVLAFGKNYMMLIAPQKSITYCLQGKSDQESANFQSQVLQSIENIGYDSVVVISFRKYLLQLMVNPELSPKIENSGTLTSIEWEVIKAIREGSVSELQIIFPKKGNHKDLIYKFDGRASLSDIDQITKRFCDKKHAKLQMTSSDGEHVSYQYEIRKRLFDV